MPFRSEAQRKWMYATHPEMANLWEEHTEKGKKLPKKVKKKGNEMAKTAAASLREHTFITGYPGTGKTTLAQSLAKELGKDLIHLDTVPGMDTAEDTAQLSRDIIDGLDRDSIVEGVQLMGINPDYFKDKDLRTLSAPRQTLIRRLVNRGFQDTPGGEIVRGSNPENAARAREFLNVWHTRSTGGTQKQSAITLDIEVGDKLLFGRYKNSPHTVKEISTDENGQPTVNGMKLLSCRINKLMPAEKQAMTMPFQLGYYLAKQAGEQPVLPKLTGVMESNVQPFEGPGRFGPGGPQVATIPAPQLPATPTSSLLDSSKSGTLKAPRPGEKALKAVGAPRAPASQLATQATPAPQMTNTSPLLAGR